MIATLLARLLSSALSRWAARAWSLMIFISAAGCSLMPSSELVTFPEHRIHGDQAAPQGIDEKRDHAEFMAAHQLWQQHDFKGCREKLEALLARTPTQCEARLLLVDLLLSGGQSQAALVQVQEAWKYHADSADVQFAMGLTLDANSRPDEALVYYERATMTAPNNNAYSLSYRTAREAAARRAAQIAGAANAGPAADKRAVVSAAVAQLPIEAQPLAPANNSPLLYAGEGQGVRANKVVPASANAVNDTDHWAEYLAQGQDALKGRSPKLAEDLFRKAIACRPENPQIPLTAAVYALKHQQAKMALDLLAPAAQRFPTSAAVFRCLGTAHLQTGDYPAAEKDLEQALVLDKSSALTYFLLGCTRMKLRQIEAADANFRQAESLDPRYAVRHSSANG